MHFTSSDTFCTAVNRKRQHKGASSWGGGDGCGEKDPKSEVEGRKVDQGMKREGREEKIKKDLNFLTLGKERKKVTEYIDFLYSLHHLYKYIESQKKEKL